ncbi:alpha/beta fold hydrolase [Curtobacterium sp. 9128]|uniref:alpha/beta fold hydrolase n=1 Tax=Curtobacterium sp. 9128 TaxID=1793722 RepID=UPI001643433D|nr:alpha/beta fold hydrolase [Curtobacterium sp. 9128]
MTAALPGRNRVPDPSASFWVTKVLTTGMGEALSDFLVTRFDPVPTVLLTAALFAVVLAAQLRADRYRPWLYWGAVSMVGVFGTMVADVTHVALGVPYAVSTPVFLVALVAVFVVWRRVEGTLDVHAVTSGRRQRWYWAAVVATFAMGTAAGDLAASTVHLGYLGGGLLFVGLVLLVVVGRATAVLGPVAAFWTAYVLTCPIGASFADFVAVPGSRGGLGVGTGLVSAVLLVAIVVAVGTGGGPGSHRAADAPRTRGEPGYPGRLPDHEETPVNDETPRHADALDDGDTADVVVKVDRIPVDGTYVRVSSIGETGERPFVLVAGLGIAATYYERLAPHLEGFGPVRALDLPGFAGVKRFRGKVTIERYADAVERVIEELGLDDPVLVGHSMGTQVVTEVAARHPEYTDLVLISPVIDSKARTVSESAVRFARSALHEPSVVRWHAVTAYALCGWHWFRRVLPQMVAFPIEQRAPHVQARTLIIRGEQDALVPRDWIRRLARVFPYAVLREVVGGAHSVMHAQADAVAALAVAHVRGELPDRGVSSLQRVRDDSTSTDLSRLSAGEAWLVVRARLAELFGMAKGDDEVLEAGKSAHALAMADRAGAPVPDAVRQEIVEAVGPDHDQRAGG